MVFNDYLFETHWRVDAPREEVFAVLTDSRELTRWWPSVYRGVDQIAPPRGDDGVGKRVRLHTQGWLPYRLRWELCVVAFEPPERLAFEASGDFVGSGEWTIVEEGDRSLVTYLWRVRAQKPLLRRFSFLLRPIFSVNHRWAMARGLESLELELARRRGEPAAPPPPPITALRSGLVIVGIGALVLLGILLLLR